MSSEAQASLPGLPHPDFNSPSVRSENGALPIHALLPTELMIHIFSSVRSNQLSDIQLTHVCRPWRAILASTPEFWADLLSVPGAASDLDFFKVLLERSYPLRFGLNFVTYTTYGARATNWDTLLPSGLVSYAHTHRITSLVVPSLTSLCSYHPARAYSLIEIFKDEEYGFPNLESLMVVSLGIFSVARRHKHRQLVSEDLPSLHHLSVPNTFFTPAIIVNSLRSLVVTPCKCNPTCRMCRIPSVGTLLSALKRCPSLTEFSIDHSIPLDMFGASNAVDPFPPGKLQKLQVVDPLVGLVAGFLSKVTHSSTTKLEVASVITSRDREYIFSEMIPPSTRALILDAAAELRAEVLPNQWCLQVFSCTREHLFHAIVQPDKGPYYTINEPHTCRLLGDIGRSFSRRTITSFVFHCGRVEFPLRPEDLRRVLLRFPHLTSFTLEGWSAVQGGKLHWLLLRALHRFAGKRTTSIPCPQLEALTLACSDGIPPMRDLGDRIAALVESRAGISRKPGRAPGLRTFTLRAEGSALERGSAGELHEVLERRLGCLVQAVYVQLN